MNKPKANRYSPEVRERAVRMVLEHRKEYSSQWAAIESIAPKIGCVPQTLHEWVRRHEIDSGTRDGVTTEERKTGKTGVRSFLLSSPPFKYHTPTPVNILRKTMRLRKPMPAADTA